MKLCKCSITFSKIFNLILSINRIKLNIKLSSLMIISSTHHRIHWRLFFACIWIIRITCWNNKIIHFFLINLLTSCCIFNVTSSSSSSIFRTYIIIIIFCSIFYTKICIAIKFLSSWSIFIACHILILSFIIILLIWHYTHRIN
jgi:hypothetical protein